MSPDKTKIEMRHIVMPQHATPHGVVFGGVIMAWIDQAAAMVAEKFTARPVATVHISDLSFEAPIKIGNHVHIQAMINYTGRTSMHIGVKVVAEDPYLKKTQQTTKAYLTFVALDETGRPTAVDRVQPNSEEETRRFNEGKSRIDANKKNR